MLYNTCTSTTSTTIKNAFEALTSLLQAVSDEVRETIILIEEQHGKPNIQHALLA